MHGLFVKSVLLTKDHLCQSTLCVGNSERKVKFQGFNSLLFSWVRGLGNILTQMVELFQTMTLHQYLKITSQITNYLIKATKYHYVTIRFL